MDVFMANELLTACAKLPAAEECLENEDTVTAVRVIDGIGDGDEPSLYGGNLAA